tara:strand:- start:4125 stop:5915 length:1791 start_codon:yes stop_codon:yes gene_type:complete
MANREEVTVAIKGQNDASPAVDKATQSIKNFDKSMKDTQRGFRLMRGGAAQLSMQVQDVAVQLQGGTNVMTVFAQQGSQIASLFGAGGAFIGAILAVGAAIGGTLLPRLFETKDRTKELQTALEDISGVMSEKAAGSADLLGKKFAELAKRNVELARAELQVKYVAALEAAQKANEEFTETANQIVPSDLRQAARLIGIPVETTAEKFGIAADEAEMLRKKFDDLVHGGEEARLEFARFVQQLADSKPLKDLDPDLAQLNRSLLTNRDAVEQSAEKLSLLKRILGDLPEIAEQSSESTVELTSKQDQFSQSLDKQLALLGATKQEMLEYQARELELAQDTSILDKIQAIIDKQAQLDEQKGIEKLQKSLMTKEEALKASYDKELALLESFGAKSAENAELVADLKIKAEERFLKRMEDLRKQSKDFEDKTTREQTQMVLDNLGGMFQGVKANNKKMFAAQKAFNIAQAMMSTYTGATKALEAYPPPLSFIMAAAQVTAGLAQVAQIKSQSFMGGGFTGHGARAGGVDGKGGFPAILHPNETVIDHTKGQGGNITIINNVDASGAGADVDMKITAAMQQTSQQTIATVQDLMRRRRM